jgi:hypothetical protein
MNPEAKLSVRCRPGNANHHLWNNNGTFWCHLTVHLPDFTKERLRVSLETRDLSHARRLRDALIRLFGGVVPGSGSAYPLPVVWSGAKDGFGSARAAAREWGCAEDEVAA